MICEMCGNEVESVTRVRVEGSVLLLCDSCQRFGKPLDPVAAPTVEISSAPVRGAAGRTVTRVRSTQERDLFAELPEMELADDWPKRIRQAREKLLWTPEEFGKRLNEKRSIVLKIESGNFRPPDTMIRKIESMLKIRLRADKTLGPAA
jgi:putative transcription factor